MYWYKLLTSVRNKENFFDTILFKTSAGIFFFDIFERRRKAVKAFAFDQMKIIFKALKKTL